MNAILDEKAIRAQAAKDAITHFATGIAVFRDGKLLVVRRAAEDDFLPGAWELPGGGVDQGETIEQGAARELFEETGLRVDRLIATFAGFDYTTPTKPNVRQVNVTVTVKPGAVRLDPAEHDQYRWITVDDIPALQANPVMQRCLYQVFA